MNWTVDPVTGRHNSSEEFLNLCNVVEGIIRGSAFDLIAGRAGTVAGLIMANLAHAHNMGPLPKVAL